MIVLSSATQKKARMRAMKMTRMRAMKMTRNCGLVVGTTLLV